MEDLVNKLKAYAVDPSSRVRGYASVMTLAADEIVKLRAAVAGCPHCRFNIISEEAHHETCEYAALKKEVGKLRSENFRMREILMASYGARVWEGE
jgi:hypothetical protein